MVTIVVRATTVSWVGTIAAVAAALIGFFIWTTPWFKRISGRDIRRALRTEGASLVVGPGGGQGVASISIGLILRNESDIALSRAIRNFDISWGTDRRALQSEPPTDDVFERQTKIWQAGLFNVSTNQFPTTFTIDYTIDYGRLDKKPSKRLVGQRIATTGPTTHGVQNMTMSETHPDRHSSI
jgi:hypothetical protein